MPEDVFRWVIAVGVLLACLATVWQAVIMTALYKAGKEAQKAGKEAQTKLAPLVERFEALMATSNHFLTTSTKVLEENGPRIADITADAVAVAKTARQQAERIGALIDDASGRAKARMAQIDETVDHTVGQVEHASEAVKDAVLKPVKEVNGFVAGVKAALSTYAQGGNRNSPEHATQDEEMFI
jgi:DNA anti-recombination protein RmuC